MKYVLLTALTYLLVGCASDITVKLSPPQPTHLTQGTLLAAVTVNDLRQPGIAASKREAAFGVPMGNIAFDPPEVHLVKETLEIELTKLLQERGVQSKQIYVCDVIEFGVNTNTTPLYWDVIGRVRLVLKHNGREYNLVIDHRVADAGKGSGGVIQRRSGTLPLNRHDTASTKRGNVGCPRMRQV